MHELIIQFDVAHPVELLGANNSNLRVIRKHFSNLKLIARGDTLKVLGNENELQLFDEKWKACVGFFNKYNRLAEKDVKDILSEGFNDTDGEIGVTNEDGEQTILFGNRGKVIKARTPNQIKMVQAAYKHDMVFAVGPAGTGKTYTAVALAVKALKAKEVQRIILTRPAVEAGESLGFLPGDLKEKLDPYLRPLYDALLDMIPHDKLASYLERSVIEIAPLAFMRGRTLANAFVILDEGQNATENQMKMFLTRMGKGAKFIITGDVTQIDLPPKIASGLVQAVKLLDGADGIEHIKLDKRDVVRHPLVEQIINRYSKS